MRSRVSFELTSVQLQPDIFVRVRPALRRLGEIIIVLFDNCLEGWNVERSHPKSKLHLALFLQHDKKHREYSRGGGPGGRAGRTGNSARGYV